jgi:hypothetical protein
MRYRLIISAALLAALAAVAALRYLGDGNGEQAPAVRPAPNFNL